MAAQVRYIYITFFDSYSCSFFLLSFLWLFNGCRKNANWVRREIRKPRKQKKSNWKGKGTKLSFWSSGGFDSFLFKKIFRTRIRKRSLSLKQTIHARSWFCQAILHSKHRPHPTRHIEWKAPCGFQIRLYNSSQSTIWQSMQSLALWNIPGKPTYKACA